MKKMRKLCGVGLVLLAGTNSNVWAQLPGAAPAAVAPAAAAPTAVSTTTVATTTTPAPQANLWSFLCPTPEQKAACKAKFCGSMFGQFINNSLAPAGALTGGIIGPCCPNPNDPNAPPNPADLAMPADSALGAAARVKQDTLAAKARRAAVRYLGTVDCNYWPEARAALINALLEDKNECVRLEAAVALQRGCCCKQDVIVALVKSVSGTRDYLLKDGKMIPVGPPAEDCERVRFAAMVALEHCLACYTDVVPVPSAAAGTRKGVEPLPGPNREPEPVGKPRPGGPAQSNSGIRPGDAQAVRLVSYSERMQNLSMEEVIQEARRALQKARTATTVTVSAGPMSHSLVELFRNASPPTAASSAPVESVPPPALAAAPASAAAPAEPATGVLLMPVPAASAPVPRSMPMSYPAVQAPMSQPAAAATTVEPTTGVLFIAAPAAPPVAPVPPRSVPAVAPTPAAYRTIPSSAGNGGSNDQLLALLQDSNHPDVREWAVKNLLAGRNASNPEVVAALIQMASTDRAAGVRVACLRGLLQLRVSNSAVVDLLPRLKTDPDPEVRRAAQDLGAWLGSRSAAPMPSSPWQAN